MKFIKKIVACFPSLSKGKRLRLTSFSAFLFIAFSGHAQNPSFIAQVSKNKVTVGEPFQVAFTLNAGSGNISLPSFNDFNIYSGPNKMENTSIVNGVLSRSAVFSLYIAAKKEGRFTIAPAVATIGNQKLETKPIVIEVTKESGQGTQGQQQNSQQQAQEKNQYSTPISNEDLFVRTYLSKSKCYLGEQLTLTQKIYSRVDFRGFQDAKFPPYTGFWSQQENAKPFSFQQENINGVMYYVADYYKTYLFPQRTGKLTIEPAELDCVVRRATKRAPRNIFEQFFGAGGYEDVSIKVKSKAVTVEVTDLPETTKPEGFTGGVGNFSCKIELSKQQVKANDAVNLKLTISGKGNIKLVDPLTLKLPESFEVYDPKIAEKITINGGVSGTKTYDYLIIPREKGEYTLSNLSFSYFDPAKKEYVVIPSPDIKLTVLEGDASSAKVITPTKKGVGESENDIRYIKTGDLELQKNDTEFFASTTHYLLLGLPVVLFMIGYIALRQYIKANSNTAAVKERKAAKMAKKQLVVAEKQMKANNKEPFFDEVLNALHKYIGNKFGLSIADLSKEKISDMLLSRQVSQDTTTRVIDTLNTCEYAKYAPSAVTGDLKKVYDDTVELISQIEEQIKK
jgi:hypothetical protein